MYSRASTQPPKKIVRNGKIKFGTFFPVPSRMDIRGVIAPFAGLPLPSPVTNFRIRGRMMYMFSFGTYIGFVEVFDGKIFGLADIVLWNRENSKKYFFHVFMPGRKRFLPVSTEKGVFSSYKKSRYIRVSWNREKKRMSLTFNLKGDAVYPSISGYVHSKFDNSQFQEFAMVTPAPVASRCSATWVVDTVSNAALMIKNKKKQSEVVLAETSALSCFVLNRMFYKFHTHAKATCGMGKIGERNLVFRFVHTSVDAVDGDSYNENILTIDGDSTLMPPVVITHPFGMNKKWIIQDTESMVDLTFTPISLMKRSLHLIFFHTRYNSVYGTFEGVLLDKNGDKIVLKDFPGLATSNMMRL